MKYSNKILALVIVSFIVGAWVYPKLPDQVASHWNSAGDVDGYMTRFWGAFLMPLVNLALYGLYKLLPKITLMKKNFESFRPSFERFFLVIMIFMVYIYAITVWWNLYGGFDIARWLLPGLALVFWEAANLIEKSKRNWFVGIRTPWTISNDKVWDETHKLGAKLFRSVGSITLASMLFPSQAYVVVLVSILVAVVVPVVYSYRLYNEIKH